MYVYVHRVDSNSVTSRELIRLQNIPVKAYDNTLVIIKLENFPKVNFLYMHMCSFANTLFLLSRHMYVHVTDCLVPIILSSL